MYAVIEAGGKQYRVTEGQTIRVEKLPQAIGEVVELDRVLMVNTGNDIQVGRPWVEGAKVLARVKAQGKGRKIIVFKYTPKTRYRRKKGHRQLYTELLIEKIVPGQQ